MGGHFCCRPAALWAGEVFPPLAAAREKDLEDFGEKKKTKEKKKPNEWVRILTY